MPSCANTFRTPPLTVLAYRIPANSGARAGCPATMCINIHNRSRNDSNVCWYACTALSRYGLWGSRLLDVAAAAAAAADGRAHHARRRASDPAICRVIHRPPLPVHPSLRPSCKNEYPAWSWLWSSWTPSHSIAGNAAANPERLPCPASSSTMANCANNPRASCANPWNISANSHTRTCTRRDHTQHVLQITRACCGLWKDGAIYVTDTGID
ncbi:hypothetical protein QIS74_02558 [Colletotrichum tabaci]|uniref:Uncharacterized protein n=1 Tax=Colletotrichum tabaci TaxID=1209068 RepID=A0AAV9TNP7_9PEZI